MCEDKKKLKEERANSKKLRTKIKGSGNTMESYSNDYVRASKEPNRYDTKGDNRKRLGSKLFYEKYNNPDSKNKEVKEDPNAYKGTYDSYKARNSDLFKNRVNQIMEGVDQKNEQNQREMVNEKEISKERKKTEKRDTFDMIDFLELNIDEQDKDKDTKTNKNKGKTQEKEIDFLDLNF